MPLPDAELLTRPVSDDYEDLPEGTPFGLNLVAGALAGIAEHTLTYPLDFIKTRMQVLHSEGNLYSGVLQAFRSVRLNEGAMNVWRGVSSVVLGAGPAHAVYFASYEWAKRVLIRDPQNDANAPLKTSAAGAVATTLADAIMTPFDVVKQRMQVHGSRHAGILACARDVLRSEGLAAFYVSYPTTLLLNVPFHAIQFPVYEFVRRATNPTSEYSPASHVLAGAAAGAIAGAVTCPIDVIKTTLQTRGILDDVDRSRISGMCNSMRFIWERKGWRGFWRGVQPRVLTFMPSTAICWTTYEYFKWVLGKDEGE